MQCIFNYTVSKYSLSFLVKLNTVYLNFLVKIYLSFPVRLNTVYLSFPVRLNTVYQRLSLKLSLSKLSCENKYSLSKGIIQIYIPVYRVVKSHKEKFEFGGGGNLPAVLFSQFLTGVGILWAVLPARVNLRLHPFS